MLKLFLKIILSLTLSFSMAQVMAEKPKAKMLDRNLSFCNVFRALNGENIPDKCKAPFSNHATRGIRQPQSTRTVQAPSVYEEAIKPHSLAFSELINFDYKSSQILPRFHKALNTVLAVLQDEKMRSKIIRIEGHTDIVGSARYNRRLSEKRALAVKNYLVQRGVNPNRIQIAGYGFEYLYDEEHPKNGINRRVEIANLGG